MDIYYNNVWMIMVMCLRSYLKYIKSISRFKGVKWEIMCFENLVIVVILGGNIKFIDRWWMGYM